MLALTLVYMVSDTRDLNASYRRVSFIISFFIAFIEVWKVLASPITTSKHTIVTRSSLSNVDIITLKPPNWMRPPSLSHMNVINQKYGVKKDTYVHQLSNTCSTLDSSNSNRMLLGNIMDIIYIPSHLSIDIDNYDFADGVMNDYHFTSQLCDSGKK